MTMCFRIKGIPVLISCFVLPFFIVTCTDHNRTKTTEETPGSDIVQIPDVSSDSEVSVAMINESRETAITSVVKKARKAIVSVKAYPPAPDSNNSVTTHDTFTIDLSGFMVSDNGYVVTKMPDTLSAEYTAEYYHVDVITHDGGAHASHIIGLDPHSGITLLKIDTGESLPYLAFGNSDSLMTGEWSIALGIPQADWYEDLYPSVSAGVISSTECNIEYSDSSMPLYPDMIRTDAVITSLSTGGPLLNANGEVIGLNTHIPNSVRSGENLGYGYAVPGNKVAKVVNYFANKDDFSLCYNMGLEMVPVTSDLANKYYLPVKYGLFVLGVNRDGPAFEAGILPGDIIIRIGDDFITGEKHAWAVLREYKKGDKMPIRLVRNHEEMDIRVLLRERLTEK